jgi:hypothetical protein
MIGKLIKKLFKSKPSKISDTSIIKESDMTMYFPQFKNIGNSQWELDFSLGNSLSILFGNSGSLLYVSSGDTESGYSTILYCENPSHMTIKYCIEKYSTEEYRVSKSRLEKLDNLGI